MKHCFLFMRDFPEEKKLTVFTTMHLLSPSVSIEQMH